MAHINRHEGRFQWAGLFLLYLAFSALLLAGGLASHAIWFENPSTSNATRIGGAALFVISPEMTTPFLGAGSRL